MTSKPKSTIAIVLIFLLGLEQCHSDIYLIDFLLLPPVPPAAPTCLKLFRLDAFFDFFSLISASLPPPRSSHAHFKFGPNINATSRRDLQAVGVSRLYLLREFFFNSFAGWWADTVIV